MNKVAVVLIVIAMMVGGWLRVKDLDKVPPHLGNDEISIAFDSYSVLKTGKDEHGVLFPLSFMSHRSYKAPLYAYVNIPQIIVWGRTENGIRMTSAIAGIVAIGALGAIGSLIGGPGVALAGAWLTALSPKLIWASRIGYESNLAVTVGLLAVLSLLVYLKNGRKVFYVISALMFGLTVWAYHTWWGLGPMLALFLPLKLTGLKRYRAWIPYWFLAIMVALPIAIDFVGVQLKDTHNRASSQLWWRAGQTTDFLKRDDVSSLKKAATLIVIPVNNYIDHFSLNGNFSSGLGLFDKRSPMGQGWYLLPTLILMIFGLIKGPKIFGKYNGALVGWWLLCPIVPATTSGMEAVRNLAMMGPGLLFAGGGLVEVVKKYRRVGGVILVALAFSFWQFYLAYYVHYPKTVGNNFQYGYKQVWEKIKPVASEYQHIVVEPKFGRDGQFVGVPHLYFGYFGAFEAEDMLKRVDQNGTKIGKYEFRGIDWFAEPLREGKSIYVVSAINSVVGDWYDKLKLVDVISTPDDQRQFLIYQSK
ncbi:MAG: hypothetical protein WCT01_03220 [Candidatus Shapirobacteria bacterium]